MEANGRRLDGDVLGLTSWHAEIGDAAGALKWGWALLVGAVADEFAGAICGGCAACVDAVGVALVVEAADLSVAAIFLAVAEECLSFAEPLNGAVLRRTDSASLLTFGPSDGEATKLRRDRADPAVVVAVNYAPISGRAV